MIWAVCLFKLCFVSASDNLFIKTKQKTQQKQTIESPEVRETKMDIFKDGRFYCIYMYIVQVNF